MSKDRFEKTYRPLPDNVQLDYSPIEGMGVFAKYDLDGKIFIGITHVAPRKKDLPRQRTPLGGFINHSDNPNCFIVVETDWSRMYTVRPIMQGEELTVYYTRKGGYKNMTELNGLIYSDTKFKDYFDRYEMTLKKRNQSKIRFESFKAFRDDLRTKVVNEREMAKHNL